MANATQECHNASRRYLQGEPASKIGRALGRTRYWFYTWLRRYNPANPVWFQDRFRVRHRIGHKTAVEVEQLVCEIRRRLVSTKYAQRGAVAIQWQLQQLGVEPLPDLWTIKPILRCHGLVEKPPYQPRGTPYPAVVASQPHVVHQLDLGGPRYLKGGERFYGVHLMNAHSNTGALAPMPSKQAVDVVEAVVVGGQTLGLPRFLQGDHELSFRGSHRHPRRFGLLIRLTAEQGRVRFVSEGIRGPNFGPRIPSRPNLHESWRAQVHPSGSNQPGVPLCRDQTTSYLQLTKTGY